MHLGNKHLFGIPPGGGRLCVDALLRLLLSAFIRLRADVQGADRGAGAPPPPAQQHHTYALLRV